MKASRAVSKRHSPMDFMDPTNGLISGVRTIPQFGKPLSKPSIWRWRSRPSNRTAHTSLRKEYLLTSPSVPIIKLGTSTLAPPPPLQGLASTWQIPGSRLFTFLALPYNPSSTVLSCFQPSLSATQETELVEFNPSSSASPFKNPNTYLEISLNKGSDNAIPKHVYSGHRWHYRFDHPEGLQ
jgi:hypothetical protein